MFKVSCFRWRAVQSQIMALAIFWRGLVLWCERSEHDKINLANCSISAFFLFPNFFHFSFLKICSNEVRTVPTWRITSQRLGAGGAFTAVRTGAKLENLHKLSGEPLPRLRQTARYLLPFLISAINFINSSLIFFSSGISINAKFDSSSS